MTPFTKDDGPADHVAVVNAVRLADHIDASMGMLSKGMPGSHIAAVMGAIPEAGFHMTLLGFVPRIRGWAPGDLLKGLKELSSIIKY